MNPNIKFSTNIKELRKSKNITQKQLAKATGISYSSIIDYENGRRKPAAKALASLEQFFGVSGAYLLGELEEKEPFYKWQDQEMMNTVKENFPSLIEQLLNTVLFSSEIEQKMLFDVFVELLHTMSFDKISSEFRTTAISLLEETFVITTKYIDLCSRTCDRSEFEKSRIEKAKNACIEEYTLALSKLQNSLRK